jgi:hypothetical protein
MHSQILGSPHLGSNSPYFRAQIRSYVSLVVIWWSYCFECLCFARSFLVVFRDSGTHQCASLVGFQLFRFTMCLDTLARRTRRSRGGSQCFCMGGSVCFRGIWYSLFVGVLARFYWCFILKSVISSHVDFHTSARFKGHNWAYMTSPHLINK